MRKTISVSINHLSKKYDIQVSDSLDKIINETTVFEKHSKIFILTDSNVADLYLESVVKMIRKNTDKEEIYSYIFEAGEKNKNLQTVKEIYEDMVKVGIDRSSIIVNLGGGVVTDMGGYAASTFLRGVPFINISTTLEGMVDASVGGKTGVNLDHNKNYIGTFTQPKAVFIDVSMLKTLPHRVLVQGYAEVLKHGIVADEQYFDDASRIPFIEMSIDQQIEIIASSIKIKSQVVEQDELESSYRKILNFGHTIGHVVESLSLETDDSLYHGEAVSIGMIAEAKICELSGMIDSKTFNKIEQSIINSGLPSRFKLTISSEDIYDLLISDKKNSNGVIKWTLLTGIGEAAVNVMIDKKFVMTAIEYIL